MDRISRQVAEGVKFGGLWIPSLLLAEASCFPCPSFLFFSPNGCFSSPPTQMADEAHLPCFYLQSTHYRCPPLTSLQCWTIHFPVSWPFFFSCLFLINLNRKAVWTFQNKWKIIALTLQSWIHIKLDQKLFKGHSRRLHPHGHTGDNPHFLISVIDSVLTEQSHCPVL